MANRSATDQLLTLKSVAAYWELLVRHGKYLPEQTSKYVTESQLKSVQLNTIFNLD